MRYLGIVKFIETGSRMAGGFQGLGARWNGELSFHAHRFSVGKDEEVLQTDGSNGSQ